MSYRLYSLAKPLMPLETGDIVTLFQSLDKPEYRHIAPVIVNDDNDVVAGRIESWEWARLQKFHLHKQNATKKEEL